jgi:hypothetical protein
LRTLEKYPRTQQHRNAYSVESLLPIPQQQRNITIYHPLTSDRILWSGEKSDFSMQSTSLWPRKPSRCLRYNIDRVLTRNDVTFTVQSSFSADKDAHRVLNCTVMTRQPAFWSRHQRHSRLFLFGRFAQPAWPHSVSSCLIGSCARPADLPRLRT